MLTPTELPPAHVAIVLIILISSVLPLLLQLPLCTLYTL